MTHTHTHTHKTHKILHTHTHTLTGKPYLALLNVTLTLVFCLCQKALGLTMSSWCICSTNVSCSDFMAFLVTRHDTCWASRMTVNPRPCTVSLDWVGERRYCSLSGLYGGGGGGGGYSRGMHEHSYIIITHTTYIYCIII